MKTKFKLLLIRATNELEYEINDFIKDKEILDLKVKNIMASQYVTHEVYILYKTEEREL